MFLSLVAPLTYVNVLHWIVRLYYYGCLLNEAIGFILVIRTFYPSLLSVKMFTQILPLYDLLLFLSLYIMLYKIPPYNFHTQCSFTLLMLWFIYIYVHYYVSIYYYYYHPLGALKYILLVIIISSSFYANHTN